MYAGVEYNLTLCPLRSREQNIYRGQPYARVDLNPICQSQHCLPVRDFGFSLWSLDFFIRSCNLGGERCGLCAEYTEVAVKGPRHRCSTTNHTVFLCLFIYYIVVNSFNIGGQYHSFHLFLFYRLVLRRVHFAHNIFLLRVAWWFDVQSVVWRLACFGAELTWMLLGLKVPKREIFDRSNFPDFYAIKSSWICGLVVKILTCYFNFWGS